MPSKGALPAAWAHLPGLALFAGMLLAGCNFINSPGGGGEGTCGTQVGDPNEVLAGCVNDENGNPAIAATVLVYQSKPGTLAKAAAYSSGNAALPDPPVSILVQTNNYGRYSITSKLPADSYDILIQANASDLQPDGTPKTPAVALKTNIRINAGGRLLLEAQQLHPRGSLKARVTDKFGGVLPGAICSDPSGRFVDTTDETGFLNMSLPQGHYSLTFSHSPQKPVTREVDVVAGLDTKLETVELSDGEGNITPALITAKYDSVTGMVHLGWPKTGFTGFFSYEVRRIDIHKFPESTLYRTSDTVFDDLVYRSRAEKDSTSLYYSVVVRTGTKTNDWAKSNLLDVKPPKVVGPDIEMGYKTSAAGSDTLDSIVVRKDSVFTVGDTAHFLARYRNQFRSNTKLLWVAKRAYDDTFAWIPEMSEPRTILALSGYDVYAYPCLLPGKIEISLTVEDELGTFNTVSLRFEIVKPKDP